MFSGSTHVGHVAIVSHEATGGTGGERRRFAGEAGGVGLGLWVVGGVVLPVCGMVIGGVVASCHSLRVPPGTAPSWFTSLGCIAKIGGGCHSLALKILQECNLFTNCSLFAIRQIVTCAGKWLCGGRL